MQPSLDAFVECMGREQAILFQKLPEAGISDSVATRVVQAWWEERRARLDAEATEPGC